MLSLQITDVYLPFPVPFALFLPLACLNGDQLQLDPPPLVPSQSVSAAVKDTQVDGLAGLNINWEAPFNFDKYVVGFRYHLGNLKKVQLQL